MCSRSAIVLADVSLWGSRTFAVSSIISVNACSAVNPNTTRRIAMKLRGCEIDSEDGKSVQLTRRCQHPQSCQTRHKDDIFHYYQS